MEREGSKSEKSEMSIGKAEEEIESKTPEENYTDRPDQSGGEAAEKEQLISWDDAEQLGVQVPPQSDIEPDQRANDQGLTPLDEIR